MFFLNPKQYKILKENRDKELKKEEILQRKKLLLFYFIFLNICSNIYLFNFFFLKNKKKIKK